MSSIFNTNPAFLSSHIFYPNKVQFGAVTYLNVNLLPDLLQYIKKKLKPQQLILLVEYQLQTFLMELSTKQKITNSFDNFVDKIVGQIRERKQFWINGKILKNRENQQKQKQQQKHQHEAIAQFQKDIKLINEQIPNYPQKTFNNCKTRKIRPYFQILKTQFMDKNKQVLKMNLTNYSMIPSYIFQQYKRQQNQQYMLPQYKNLKEQSKNQLKMLQNTLQYFLIIQRMASSPVKKNQAKTRQLIRNRPLPSYLQGPRLSIEQNQLESSERQSHFHHFNHHNHNISIQSSNLQNIQKQVQIESQPKSKHEQIPQYAQQKEPQPHSQQKQSSSEQQTQFYIKFHSLIQRKQSYDSKMFTKEATIRQSHNMMMILRCLIYVVNNQQQKWFERQWREIEEQKMTRQRNRKDQEDEQSSQEESQKGQKNHRGQQGQHKRKEDQLIPSQAKQKQGQLINSQPQLREGHEQSQQGQIMQQEQNQLRYEHKQGQRDKQEDKQQNKQEQKHEDKQGCKQDDVQQESVSHSDQKSQNRQVIIQQEQVIQIGIKKPIFDQTWRNPTTYSFRRLAKNLSHKFLCMRQTYFLVKQYLDRKIPSEYLSYKLISASKQTRSESLSTALVNPQVDLQQIFKQFTQMIEHPQNIKLSSFKTQGIKIPWQQKDYLMFLKGLLQYFFIPTNNRKIAQYMMGKHNSKKTNIQANHVKHVKGIYLKNMQVRVERGESGGAKKGRMLGKLDFLQKDIEFFSMKWFEKIKKIKKKKNRRRIFQENHQAGEEMDSAY